jgi:hypothetical protein
MSDSILQAGLRGVQSGIDQFGRASGQVAAASNSTSSNAANSSVESVVAVKQAQQTVETSAAVIKLADEIA